MHCTLWIPGLLPAPVHPGEQHALDLREAVTALRLPALEQLLARGRTTHRPGASLEHALLQQAQATSPTATPNIDADELPAGVLSLAAIGETADAHTHWMRADPVHLKVNRDTLQVIPAALFDFSATEAHALIQTLNQHFSPALTFRFIRPQQWVVRVQPEVQSSLALKQLRTQPLCAVVGQDIQPHLPSGPTSKHWHSLMNELQMLLYADAINDAREQRGAPVIHGVWFWGHASLPALISTDAATRTHWYSDDLFVCGLAAALREAHSALPQHAARVLPSQPSAGRAAVVLDTLRHPLAIGDLHIWYERMQQLERDWFTPMLEALRHEHIGMLTLIDPNHTSQIQIETTRQDLRRFWRRIKPLTHYLPT